MALNDLNAHFAISGNYEDLVLIRGVDDDGSDKLMHFYSYILSVHDFRCY